VSKTAIRIKKHPKTIGIVKTSPSIKTLESAPNTDSRLSRIAAWVEGVNF
jgi:hypothetical protein